MTIENPLLLRTIESNKIDLELKSRERSSTHINGIKSNSVLNQLKYFNVVTGLPPDAMHDLLEGVVRQTFNELMNYLSANKIYNSDKLNEDLKNLKYDRVDKINKVPSDLFSNKSSFKISATHQWMLMRIFPIFAGERLFSNQISRKHYLNYLQVSEITRAIYDDNFTQDKINSLRNNIKCYLSEFLNLYPHKKLTPKQHFLLHYPTAVENWGPPRFYTTMRFESKHSYFKKVINANHNNINLCYSLANRHQNLQVHHLLSENYFLDLELGSQHQVDKHTLDFIQINNAIKSKKIELFKWIKKRGIKYQIKDLIVTSKSTMPIFSVIKSIIIKSGTIFFLISEYETIRYNSNLACYMIKERESMFKFFDINNLINIWPLGCYSINSQHFLVSPKYPLI